LPLKINPGSSLFGIDEQAMYSKWLERHERELHGSTHIGELSPFWSPTSSNERRRGSGRTTRTSAKRVQAM